MHGDAFRAAKMLIEDQPDFTGNVKLMFQPADFYGIGSDVKKMA